MGLLWLASALPAQVTTGSISGFVHDASERPVVNASVACLDASRSVVRRTMTDGQGFYRFVELAPAAYSLTANAPGLEEVKTETRLAVNSQVRVSFRLPVAGRRESVTVQASVAVTQTETSELGSVFDQSRIERLPLNRRDFLQLALLSPGVSAPVEDSELSSRGGFAMHAGGGREEFNNYLLDGVDNNDPNVNRYVLQPSVDAIQEFKISTANYSAEYGRGAAGQVNVITRRGANDLHGALYEYWRNRTLDARNFFDPADNPKFARNQFGFSLGGPLLKNRTFFFANADFLRERRGLSRLGTVPTAAERRGDLSGSPVAVVDPFTRQPFPGRMIPANRISSVGTRVVELFPLPNRSGATGNYLPQPVLSDDQSQGHARLDHRLSEKDDLTFRYSHGLVDLTEPYAEDTDAIPGFGDLVTDTGRNAMVHHQRVISARTIHSLRLGFSRFSREIVPENSAVDVAQRLGVNWLRSGARDSGYPAFNVAGYSRVGDATSLPILRHTNTYQILEGISLVRGAHALKFGADLRRYQLNGTLDLLTRGSLSFSGALSNSGIGDLLLGFPSFGIQAVADNPQTLRTTASAFYMQDDWKVRPDFTLNFGMRYEYATPPTDPFDRMSSLDFRTGQVARVGTAGVTRSGIRPDRNNFGPRAGFAWSLTPRFVLRGGYGIYHDSGMFVVNSAQYFNPPQFLLRIFFPTQTSLLTLDNPFPVRGGIVPPASLNLLNPDTVGATMQQWNFSVQRDIARTGTLSLAYAGSKGTHLIRSRNLNQPRPGAGDVQARRPTPAYGSIFFAESGANSSYHSLQTVFSRPLASRLSVTAVYTFSKSIDDTSAFLGTKADKNFPQDSRNYALERGLSSFDTPHRLALSHIYMLPGRSWWSRNTELRGITTAQSGQPMTPILRFDNSNTGNTGGQFGSDRPNILRDPRLSSPGSNAWFDTGAFRTPARFTFGSAGRNIVRGPGLFSVDLSLARRFSLSDRAAVDFEAQGFNILNRANFAIPELYADETAFGRIFAAKAPRQLQFSLRLSF